jgi:hypothetical protein
MIVERLHRSQPRETTNDTELLTIAGWKFRTGEAETTSDTRGSRWP